METVTRTDSDLQDYFIAIQSKNSVEEEDITRLLDAYRIKFDVDFAYVGESTVGDAGVFFAHASYSDERYNLVGKVHKLRGDWSDALNMYDSDGLCDKSFDPDSKMPCGGILHYGIMHNQEYVGNIGLIDFHKKRVWTDEERLAVCRLGRVLRHILYVEYENKVNEAEQQKVERQSNILESIFSTTECGIMRHTLDGSRIISINRAALNILGYRTESEMIEDGFNMVAMSVMDEDKPKLKTDIESLTKVGSSTSVAYRVQRKDGSVLDVVGRVKLMEENGEKFYQRFLFDCTAQKETEVRERMLHKEMIRALSVDFGSVYFLDLDTGMAVPYRLNSDMTRRYGSIFVGEIPIAENLERYISDVVYEHDRDLLRQAATLERFRQELSEKETYYTNYRTIRDGKIEYFQMKAARAGAWKDTRRIVLGFRSVDDEIRHEMAQKKLVEDSYEIIAGLSSDYNFIGLMNVKDGSISAFKSDETRPDVVNAWSNCNNYRDAVEAYAEYVCSEDREMWLESAREDVILENIGKKKIYYITVRSNFCEKTEYVQFSFTRVSGTEHGFQVVLAQRLVTETMERELKQRALVENALAQAKQANSAKSTFLSNMSHDIRTPMNAIIGFTALATTHIDQKERIKEYLEKIMASSNHLLSLINDVLDMSRIESGKIRIEEKPCSLPEILHDLRNILQSEISSKRLELYIDTVDVLNENIYCDKLRLNQVLLNLLGNAIKFTGAGGTITVRIIEKPSSVSGSGNYEFHVKDTGIGMSKEFSEHIFEPFERERTSTVSGIQGTGLGMAITKNIVDMMNGTIEVKSEQGVGTEFTVSLPFRLQSSPNISQTIPELKGCRALVVDDDFNTCDSVTGMLFKIGMRPEWTMSGKEALLRTRQALDRGDEYRVYIIDWLMPDMNGVEVTRRIRSEVGDNAPIIVLSAYDWSDIESEAREAGVTAFCSKPLFLSELRECLISAVNPESADNKQCTNKQTELFSDPVKNNRILLAEDNELNREIATEILGEAGFVVDTAENGKIAVDMLSRSEEGYYSLILMDIQMPVMDGYEATGAIRRLENKRLASIPILAMTANAFEEDRRNAAEAGMDGHIAKPIDVKNLFESISAILEKQPSACTTD